MCFCAKLKPTATTLYNSKHLVIKDSKNTSRTDCGIYTENNILCNHSTMGKDTSVPFLSRFWGFLGVGCSFFFFWVGFSINFTVKIMTCKQYSFKNLNRGILVSLVNQRLQCCPRKPGIWSDIKIIIYLAKAGGLVHMIWHLKPGKRWKLSSDGVHR